METWKDIHPSFNATGYEVSTLGRIRNKSTGYIFQGKPRDDGYIRVTLSNSMENTVSYIHIVVAKTFIDCPSDDMTVDHINRIRDDNRVENLRWVTSSQQTENQNHYCGKSLRVDRLSLNGEYIDSWNTIKEASITLSIYPAYIGLCCKGSRESAGGYKWRYTGSHEIDNEVWKSIPIESDVPIYASNMGRIKRNNKILHMSPSDGGYFRTSITHNGQRKKYMVHRLVCTTFKGIPTDEKLQVNHIDGDKLNNKIDNLEWVTCKDNVRHSHDTGLWKTNNAQLRARAVDQYDMDGNLVGQYDSITEASNQTGIDDGEICTIAKNKRNTAGGFIWRYKGEVLDIIPKRKSKRVIQYLNGVEIARFDSLSEARKITGCNPNSISRVCKGIQDNVKGFKWEFY